ncbi:AgmX/PglI C-terminal domain-containing protein [Polyangium aurulentum]|uniref:AgmX/PglI C-terminal domain-containing protein n=1 Tax=Polyangium aurulentum TaxID=2567896 RepID=UPI0010AEA485|nr:AgmX/PglI C-terminal domain-containing protein [Polyangium aurulentum]UQA59008.1 AgmX/PglI C-terminal domain-containing protein [Polyangium aurulentum]
MLERSMIGELDASLAAPSDKPVAARGMGTLTARLPGTSAVTEGVRLAAHRVRVKIEGSYARTEIEEEFFNETDRVLEGRYVFPLPRSASISRLALWVDKELVEGEIVEAPRAASIFGGIVDDTVRPRDPALLEWTHHREFSLKVFPIPAKGRRKVLVAYDQALPRTWGDTRYMLPLGPGADPAVPVDEFSLELEAKGRRGTLLGAKAEGLDVDMRWDEDDNLTARYSARAFFPPSQFVLQWSIGQESEVMVHAPKGGAGDRFFAASVAVRASDAAISGPRPARDRVLVLDAGAGQTPESFAQAVTIAESIAGRMGPEARFAVLVCDSACTSFPERGLSTSGEETFTSLRSFLRGHTPGGASDLAGALASAADRLDPARGGQVVYLGEGTPTAGELSAATVSARVAPALAAHKAELRLLGIGRSLDEDTLSDVAARLGASYDPVDLHTPPASRIAYLIGGLDSPVLTDAKLDLPPGFVEAYPGPLPALRAQQHLFVVGKLAGEAAQGTITLRGTMAGEAVEVRVPVTPENTSSLELPFLPRLWAEARIASLEGAGSAASEPEIVALSKQHHVMSRHTSLLVLENDRMFAAYGIPRTQGAGTVGGVSAEASPASDAPARITGDEGGGGFGSAADIGRLDGIPGKRVPTIRALPVTVNGLFPPELVRRIVRQSFGRFRLCYEAALQRNPELSGRVTVRFVIERDGSVSNPQRGTSDIPDTVFVDCVVRGFSGLLFPQPDAGTIIVTYPLTFAPPRDVPDPLALRARSAHEGPRARHADGDEQWRAESHGADELAKLRSAVEAEPMSRKRHEAYVKALLLRGRFPEALEAAKRLSGIDPDSVKARDLYAQAAAAHGDIDVALRAIDTLAASSPRSGAAHQRAARAFEAAGDERRACAHWRSLAEISIGSEDARYEALRCRARALGEREAVRGELSRMNEKGKRLTDLAAALEKSDAPAYAPPPAVGGFEVRLSCSEAADRCPKLAVLAPDGAVLAPVTPGHGASGAGWIAVPSPASGVYRTMITGGAPGVRATVELKAFGAVKKVELGPGEGIRTVATTTIERTEQSFGGAR